MARLLGPDMGSRYCYLASGAPAANLPAVVYANAAGTILADLAAYQPGSPTVPGGTILGSAVTVDGDGLLPRFWFPTDGTARLWVSVAGGTVTPIDADHNGRLDIVVREGPLSLKDPRVGAALDGSNESAKLTAAVGLLPAGGGHIFVSPGSLGLGSEVTLPDNITLTGATHGGSVIRPSTGYTGRLISTGVYNRIAYLKFDGQSTSGVLLTIRQPRGMFHNLHFANSGGDAIEFAGTGSTSSAHANKITDINIEDCLGRGIWMNTWCYDNEFLNVWIGECQVGMRLQDGANFFTNLHVWGCVGNGIELRSSAHLNRFNNCYIETNGTGGTGNGVDAFQVHDNLFTGCRVWKNNNYGIMANQSHRTVMMASTFHENGADGMRGTDSLYCQAIGNQFYDPSLVGGAVSRQDRPIVTTGTSDYWIITSNVMRTADHFVGGKSLVGANNVTANNIE